mgnify:FL=1
MQDSLPKRVLGRTGLEVTQLGFGGAERGLSNDTEADPRAESILNAVLDAGINLIDTAPDYGANEERIGKYISHRREEFYLATKCGCNIDPEGKGLEPGHLWTADRVRRNVEHSLRRLKTDHVDLLQMHNPSVEEVERGGLVQVLEEIRQAGKTRFIGVSSTAPQLMRFVEMGVFDTFQVPYSALERRHEQMIQQAADAGAGIVIRGGIGVGHRGGDELWAKWNRARLDEIADGMGRYEFVLRFTLTHPSCHTTIVGTQDPEHLSANVAAAKAGPLSPEVYRQAQDRLAGIGEDSEGL